MFDDDDDDDDADDDDEDYSHRSFAVKHARVIKKRPNQPFVASTSLHRTHIHTDIERERETDLYEYIYIYGRWGIPPPVKLMLSFYVPCLSVKK